MDHLKSSFRKVKEFVEWHYTDTSCIRSDLQLEREKWLIPRCISFNRFMLMPAAILIQICCGSLYAWSGYNLPIEAKLYGYRDGVDRAIAVNVFYVATAIYALNASFLGPWLERNGPLKGALLGACVFYFGNLVTALGVYTNQLWLIYVGYSGFAAAGMGISYISPVSPLQKWFPELRGIAAGLAVCGFGAGSIFSPFTQKALIGPTYATTGKAFLGIELTFVILGSCYFVVMSCSALVLRMPPPGYSVKGMSVETVKGAEKAMSKTASAVTCQIPMDQITTGPVPSAAVEDFDYSKYFSMSLGEALTSSTYWMIYFMFMGAEITGLLIISKIQSIAQNQLLAGKGENDAAYTAADINSGLGGVNLLGRIILPLISDVIKGRKPLFILSVACQAICLGCLPSALENSSLAGVLICAYVICFFYGGGFGLIPAFLADQFGAKNVGATHGVILTAWAAASVFGGLIFSAVYRTQHDLHPDKPLTHYTLNFQWILGPVLVSFILANLIPARLRDRKLPKVDGETFRIRIFDWRLLRIVHGKLELVPKEKEKAEWNQFLACLPYLHKSDTSQKELHRSNTSRQDLLEKEAAKP